MPLRKAASPSSPVARITPSGPDRSPHTSCLQNGRIERSHLTIFNTVRTVLIDSGFPQSFWAEAAAYACQVRNRTPNKATGRCPQELWSGRPSQSYDNIHAFGENIYVRDHRQSDKLKPRYFAARFLGWESDSNSTIRYYDPRTKSIGFSRDVVYRKPDAIANPPYPTPAPASSESPTVVPVPVEVFDVAEEDDDSDAGLEAEGEVDDARGSPDTERNASTDVDPTPIVSPTDDTVTTSDTDSVPDVLPKPHQPNSSPILPPAEPTPPAVLPSRITILNRKPKESKYQTSKLVRICGADDVAPRDTSRIVGEPSRIDKNGRRIQPARKTRQSALITHAVLPHSYKQAMDSPEREYWWKALLDELAKM